MEKVSKCKEIEVLDAALRALSRQRAQSAHALCHHLLRFDALNGPASLGFASIREYGEHALGLTAREIRECLRVGRRLRVLARVDEALEAGTLSWSAARALTRVAVPETEAEWLRQALSGPMRELEAAVSVSSAGDLPPDADTRPVSPAVTRFVFEVGSVDAQVVADALALRRADLGGDLDVADVFVDLCRSALASAAGAANSANEASVVPATDGPGPAPAAGIPPERFQIVLQKCPNCVDVVHVGHGSAAHLVAPSVVAQAECDAVVVDVARGGHLTRTIPPKLRRRVAHRDGYCCVVPGCGARLPESSARKSSEAAGTAKLLPERSEFEDEPCWWHGAAPRTGQERRRYAQIRRLEAGDLGTCGSTYTTSSRANTAVRTTRLTSPFCAVATTGASTKGRCMFGGGPTAGWSSDAAQRRPANSRNPWRSGPLGRARPGGCPVAPGAALGPAPRSLPGPAPKSAHRSPRRLRAAPRSSAGWCRSS